MSSRRERVFQWSWSTLFRVPQDQTGVDLRAGTGDRSILCDIHWGRWDREANLGLVSRRYFSVLLNTDALPGVVMPGPGEIQAGTQCCLWNGNSTWGTETSNLAGLHWKEMSTVICHLYISAGPGRAHPSRTSKSPRCQNNKNSN